MFSATFMRTAKGREIIEIIQVMSYCPRIIFKDDILLYWGTLEYFLWYGISPKIWGYNISRRKITTILVDR